MSPALGNFQGSAACRRLRTPGGISAGTTVVWSGSARGDAVPESRASVGANSYLPVLNALGDGAAAVCALVGGGLHNESKEFKKKVDLKLGGLSEETLSQQHHEHLQAAGEQEEGKREH